MWHHEAADGITPGASADEPAALRTPRVVIVECYSAHGECLEFQIKACQRAGMQVEVWTTRRNRWRPHGQNVRHVILREPACLHAAWRLWRSPPVLLVINTATGPVVRDLLVLVRPLRIATIGIFHDFAKIRAHFSTRLIARLLTGRLMLAEHLAAKATHRSGLSFTHVHLLSRSVQRQPQRGVIDIVIPGAFAAGKKDAEALLRLASDPRLDQRVRFILLGRFSRDPAMAEWWQRCVAVGVAGRLVRFDGFVPQERFDQCLEQAWGIMPLIHPGCEHYERFRDEKISGAVNLALGAHLPLLIPSDLAQEWNFGPVVSPYVDHGDLVGSINELARGEALDRLRSSIAASPQAHVAHQQALYLRACVGSLRVRQGKPDMASLPTPAVDVRPGILQPAVEGPRALAWLRSRMLAGGN